MTRRALLFDLDGTLVASETLHHQALNRLLSRHDRPAIDLNAYNTHVMGNPNIHIMARLFEQLPHAHRDLADCKDAIFRESLGDDLQPTAGTHQLLDWAASEGFSVGVVTNAGRENAEALLKATSLQDRFDTLIVAEECGRSKPDPRPYQRAMQVLGTTPSRAIAFEDSRSGLRSARRSGAYTFGMTTACDALELRQAGAQQTIDDFNDPVLWAHLNSLKASLK